MLETRKIQRYQQTSAIERLLLLLAVLLKNPGIGCKNDDGQETNGTHHESLIAVQIKIRELAQQLDIPIKEGYPATATLRKDLEILRDYQILDRRMYRWGYYLGTGALTPEELRIAFNALESQAIYQGDPRIRQIYFQLSKRLRGFELPANQDFFYPVRQHLNRAINYTDPQEMMEKGEYRNTLFHQLDQVEQAIIQGQAIEICRAEDPYQYQDLGMIQLYPLQLIYYDIAWYLLYESSATNCLVVARVNRFSNYCKVLLGAKRDLEIQKESLRKAYKLLENGWGLKLGNLEEQIEELNGEISLLAIEVRFFPPVSEFIEEGERRHPLQKIKHGKRDKVTGKPEYIDYLLKLPPRSLDEFSIWVQRYGDKALVLSPFVLVERHQQAAIALVKNYNSVKADIDKTT